MGLYKMYQEWKEKKAKILAEANKPKYDVNLPIEKYSDEQILERIADELGDGAMDEYKNMNISAIVRHYISGAKLQTRSGYGANTILVSMTAKYFLNEFYKQAVTQKARKMLYNKYKVMASEVNNRISAEQMQNDWQTILNNIYDLINEAKEEVEIANNNAVEMKKIDEIFSDVSHTV